jgi:HAD superfamily hydrolase (TIGR01509 family)
MIQGVIFDLDGLMFDTERMWATFWQPALASLGLPYSEGLDTDARGTAGESMRAVLRKHYGENCDADAIIERLHEIADHTFEQPVPKKPGLDELLAFLKQRGIPMAVASSSRAAVVRRHLTNGNILPYFDAIITGDMVTRSKPSPDIFYRAAEALGTQPANCLVLEDSYNGVRAGHAGGFITIMVPDLSPVNDEMRRLYTKECASLHEVRELLESTDLMRLETEG